MRRSILLLMLNMVLGGCTTGVPAGYGNTTRDASAADGRRMAKDVAAKLSALFPPAYNKLRLQHATADVFGTTLVESLRRKGYALSEFNGKARSGPAAKAGAPNGDLNLAYIVDQPLEPGLVRVTLFINAQSLSRVYQSNGGDIAAAGYWVRKE